MNNNKIAFFYPSFQVGGVENVMTELVNCFHASGIDVCVIVCFDHGKYKAILNPTVKVYALGKKLRTSIFALRRMVKSLGVSTIISGPDFPNFVSIIACMGLKGVQTIVTQHNLYHDGSKKMGMGIVGRLIPTLYRILYPRSSKIIAVSSGARIMLENFGMRPPKLIEINNPINLARIDEMSRYEIDIHMPEKYIIFVGRLSLEKNIQLLIKAYIEMTQEKNPFDLVLIGDGPEKENLEKLVRDCSRASHIHFLGAQANPYPFIRRASLLVLPSISEAFPCVLLESMALGVTPVVTPASGSLEIIDSGKYGYISPSFEDYHLLSNSIQKAFDKPIEKDILVTQASKFESHTIADKYIAAIGYNTIP